ncbi:DoxX family protein [Brachybacterium sacelli]|uniref:Oxidoreductase n=1 Tax=Brachybacterium sacelli TaxID=173364 RepID=A0ABS4X6S3_9MICO|nr:DoxX family protein [Brachybacterium sacelli]MBP2384130.1 putative oxidoreductase [Brachybacterium sacelli]
MTSATTALPAALRDPALLLARLVVGAVFMAHGWQKIGQNGIAATTEGFVGMGIPFAEIAAPVVAYVELIGGALLILGLLTAVAGLALAIDMAVAAFVVHLGGGLFVADGGWELVGVLGAAALLLAAVGPGRIALARGARSRGRSGAKSSRPGAHAA